VVTYTFTVYNVGNVTLGPVTVTDDQLGPITNLSPAPPLAPGDSTTGTATLTLTQALLDAGFQINIATATGTPPTGSDVTDTATQTVDFIQNLAISVVKTGTLDMTVVAPTTQADVGDKINYSFLVTNTGNVTLSNVTVSDSPALTTGPVPASVASLAPGASTTFIGSYTLTQADLDAGKVDDVATATGTPAVGGTTSGTDDDTVDIPSADLSIIKSDSPDPVLAGNNLTYTLTVTNNGPSNATNVVVKDTLPSGVTYISATPLPTTVSGSNLTWNVGNLNSGVSTIITITVKVKSSIKHRTFISNTATVSGTEHDSNPNNNTSTAITEVNPEADLSITKTGSPDVVLPGNNITYTITVTNEGPSNATGVVVTDLLPAGVTFVSAKGTQGDFNLANRTLTWNVGTLSVGSSATLTIVVTVNTTCEGGQQLNNRVNTECAQCNVPIKMPTMCPIKDGAVLINKASVRANETDPNLWNNVAFANTKISVPNLTVTKKDELLKNTGYGFMIGQSNTIRYTVVITNAGKMVISGFTFSDTPDTNSILVVGSIATTSGVVVTGNTTGDTSVVVNLGTIPAGGKATITFKVTVNKTLPYKTIKISNQGVVSDNNSLTWLSDDPDTRAVGDPTVTQIALAR
jgi:uncharacterized repeat protein (TIGR01451 family)